MGLRLSFIAFPCLLLFLFAPRAVPPAGELRGEKESPANTLSRIYQEVKELGPYPGQNFIRWDFFIGEGDDDTNKPIQAVVLIQNWGPGERMAILISRMEASPGDPNVFWNKETKEISCRVRDKTAEIISSMYTFQEMEQLLPRLLGAIKDKKNLLKN